MVQFAHATCDAPRFFFLEKSFHIVIHSYNFQVSSDRRFFDVFIITCTVNEVNGENVKIYVESVCILFIRG